MPQPSRLSKNRSKPPEPMNTVPICRLKPRYSLSVSRFISNYRRAMGQRVSRSNHWRLLHCIRHKPYSVSNPGIWLSGDFAWHPLPFEFLSMPNRPSSIRQIYSPKPSPLICQSQMFLRDSKIHLMRFIVLCHVVFLGA